MKPTSLFYYQERTANEVNTHCRECLTPLVLATHDERMCYDKFYRRPICTTCKDKLIAKHALNLTLRRQDKNEGQYRITSQQASFRDRMKHAPKVSTTPAATVGVRA